jgi:DNA replication protein DnaC
MAYERSILVVTTNLPFENWTEVQGCEWLTGAVMDRLTPAATFWKPSAKAIGCRKTIAADGRPDPPSQS